MRLSLLVPQVVLKCGQQACRAPVTQTARSLTTLPTLLPDIDFMELKQKLEADQVTLIDVRLPKEHVEYGMIPNSKKIKLQTLGIEISLPDEEFFMHLGFKKPGPEDPIVMHCMGGVRARTAQLAMIGAGYKNVRVYAGSYEDWVEQGGTVEYPEASAET